MLVLAIAMLPWVALSRIGEWRSASAPVTDRIASDSIESFRSRAVVTSERLSFALQGKRADGTRQVWTTPPLRLGTSVAQPFAWAAWPSASLGRTDPVAFCLACRGPPPPSAE